MRRFRNAGRLVVAGALAVWTVWAAAAAFVILVDPYDLHPWGAKAELPGAYQPFHGDRYLSIAVKDPHADLVLIGSSPATPYSPADLRAIHPDAARPWNVSLHGGLARDRLVVMDAFARASGARRYVITVDVFLAAPEQKGRADFPFFAHDDAAWNDLRIVRPQAVRDAIDVLRFGSPEPDPAAVLARERAFNDSVAPAWRTPARRRRLIRTKVEGADISVPGRRRTCADFPAATDFMAAVARLRATGARVDLLIPTYASALWHDWLQDGARRREFGRELLSDQLAMRRCVVTTADGLGVAVHAQWGDPAIFNDLRRYRDPGHVQGQALADFIALPNDPSTRLTVAGFEDYAASVSAAARAFDPLAPW